MAKFCWTFGLFFLIYLYCGLSAQEVEAPVNVSSPLRGTEDDLIPNLVPSAQLALSTPDYPVTAGDVYTLVYLAGS